jgi:hypothetical protein
VSQPPIPSQSMPFLLSRPATLLIDTAPFSADWSSGWPRSRIVFWHLQWSYPAGLCYRLPLPGFNIVQPEFNHLHLRLSPMFPFLPVGE